MDKQQTIEFVNQLVQEADLPAGAVSECVDSAAIPDDQGHLPNSPEWHPTFDPWWAAADAALARVGL